MLPVQVFCVVLLSSLPQLTSAFSLPQFRSHLSTSLQMSSTTQQMDKAKSLISNAISIGAPAYNAGDISECARVYKETALEIASLLPQNLQNGLEATIAAKHEDSNEEAWAFRQQFDSIVEYQIPFMPETDPSESSSDKTKFTLEKFTDKMIPSEPLIVNDNVMGGVSQGQWMADSKIFRGNTSLANNGGFSSLRWRLNTIQNWSYAKGIYLKVKHSNPDVHTFRIILKDMTCEQVRGANFKNVFSNPSQTDEPIFIPFQAFDQIEQMGRALSGPVFNRGAVIEVGLMAIKPTVVGEFQLQIEEWGLYL
jgi:hypothetical protein